MNEEILKSETFACFSCMQPNEFGTKFCKFCNAPISQTSSSDPLQIAYGEGMAYRKAVEGKPRLLVVIGVWIMFFPTMIVSFFLGLETLLNGYGSMGFVIFWIMFLLTAFSLVMIYRVTKNYISMDKFDHGETEYKDVS